MEKYNKTVIARRFRKRRRARQRETSQAPVRYYNLFLGIFAIGTVIVLAIVIFAFIG
ncbi:MAG: hypothetical protein ACTSU8_00820 [Alphaproteobacteria bacterium]